MRGNLIVSQYMYSFSYCLYLIYSRWEGENITDFQLLISYVEHIFSFVFDLWVV